MRIVVILFVSIGALLISCESTQTNLNKNLEYGEVTLISKRINSISFMHLKGRLSHFFTENEKLYLAFLDTLNYINFVDLHNDKIEKKTQLPIIDKQPEQIVVKNMVNFCLVYKDEIDHYAEGELINYNLSKYIDRPSVVLSTIPVITDDDKVFFHFFSPSFINEKYSNVQPIGILSENDILFSNYTYPERFNNLENADPELLFTKFGERVIVSCNHDNKLQILNPDATIDEYDFSNPFVRLCEMPLINGEKVNQIKTINYIQRNFEHYGMGFSTSSNKLIRIVYRRLMIENNFNSVKTFRNIVCVKLNDDGSKSYYPLPGGIFFTPHNWYFYDNQLISYNLINSLNNEKAYYLHRVVFHD